MKQLFSMMFALCILLSLLTACGASTAPESASPESASSESVPPESTPAAQPEANGRIPLEDWAYIKSFSDPLPEETDRPQLACQDDTAARLARAIDPLIWLASTAEPPFFDEEHPLDVDTAARIAFDNTRRLDFGGLSFLPEGFSSGGYEDHPITKRIAQLWEDGDGMTCDVIYADDAAANLERLFGITDWEHHTVAYYNYFPEEGVYITYGDLIRGIDYPQVLSWEETENGYRCEMVVADNRLGAINNVELTEENILELAATVPHYLFTFDMTTGEPVVTSFQQKP